MRAFLPVLHLGLETALSLLAETKNTPAIFRNENGSARS
jgi:hypothetical protein